MNKWERKYKRFKKRHARLRELFKEVLELVLPFAEALGGKLTEVEELFSSKKKGG